MEDSFLKALQEVDEIVTRSAASDDEAFDQELEAARRELENFDRRIARNNTGASIAGSPDTAKFGFAMDSKASESLSPTCSTGELSLCQTANSSTMHSTSRAWSFAAGVDGSDANSHSPTPASRPRARQASTTGSPKGLDVLTKLVADLEQSDSVARAYQGHLSEALSAILDLKSALYDAELNDDADSGSLHEEVRADLEHIMNLAMKRVAESRGHAAEQAQRAASARDMLTSPEICATKDMVDDLITRRLEQGIEAVRKHRCLRDEAARQVEALRAEVENERLAADASAASKAPDVQDVSMAVSSSVVRSFAAVLRPHLDELRGIPFEQRTPSEEAVIQHLMATSAEYQRDSGPVVTFSFDTNEGHSQSLLESSLSRSRSSQKCSLDRPRSPPADARRVARGKNVWR